MRERRETTTRFFNPLSFENIGDLALTRDFTALAYHRDKWLNALLSQRSKPTTSPGPNWITVGPSISSHSR